MKRPNKEAAAWKKCVQENGPQFQSFCVCLTSSLPPSELKTLIKEAVAEIEIPEGESLIRVSADEY